MLGVRLFVFSMLKVDSNFTRVFALVSRVRWVEVALPGMGLVPRASVCGTDCSRFDRSSGKVFKLAFRRILVRAWYLFHLAALLMGVLVVVVSFAGCCWRAAWALTSLRLGFDLESSVPGVLLMKTKLDCSWDMVHELESVSVSTDHDAAGDWHSHLSRLLLTMELPPLLAPLRFHREPNTGKGRNERVRKKGR